MRNTFSSGRIIFWPTSKDAIDEFAKAYSEYKIPFYAQSYLTTLNEYTLSRLVEAGFHRLGMGVEHGNEEFRRVIIDCPHSNRVLFGVG